MDGEVSAEEFHDLLDSGDLRIVDVRSPAAFASGHIPGSENIPLGRLTAEVDQLDGADRVVTVCPHGQASVQAARLIAAYEGCSGPVESLASGLEGWDGDLTAGESETTRP
ncbi:MAG: rhodanese-like domain-containing protein [archaeon]